MPAPLTTLLILWFAIGCLLTSRCRFATASRGWQGQATQFLAAGILTVIWPVLALARARSLLS